MPGSPEQIRAAMEGLTPEQQAQFMSELEKRRGQAPAPEPESKGFDWSSIARPGINAMNTGAAIGLPVAAAVLGGPAGIIPALRGLGLGVAGTAAGGYAGKGIGQGLEYAGAPEGTSEVLGGVGGLAGGLAGPIGGAPALAKVLQFSGGKAGLLAKLLGAGERAAVSEAAPVVAAKASAGVADDVGMAIKQARLQAIKDKSVRDAEWHAERMRRSSESVAAGAKQAKKAGVTSTKSTVEPAAPTTAKVPGPDDTLPPTPVSKLAVPTADPTLVLKIQQAGGLKNPEVQKFLATQPVDVAEELIAALSRRQAKLPTIHGKLFDPTKPGYTQQHGYELAKLLGQVE